jgi:Zn finger protein HypA/HybF involved in hydrogenase expression
MHESRLARDLVDKAVSVAQSVDIGTVDALRIEIGALNHATPSSLGSILQDTAAGTTVEDVNWDISKSDDATSPNALDVRLVSAAIRKV